MTVCKLGSACGDPRCRCRGHGAPGHHDCLPEDAASHLCWLFHFHYTLNQLTKFGETHFFLNLEATIVDEMPVWGVSQVSFRISQHVPRCDGAAGSLRHQDVFVKIFFFSSPHWQPAVQARQHLPRRMGPESGRRSPLLLEPSVQSNQMGAHHCNTSLARRWPRAK